MEKGPCKLNAGPKLGETGALRKTGFPLTEENAISHDPSSRH